MRPGDLVRPVYRIELCDDIELEEYAADANELHLCIVLDEATIGGSRHYEKIEMLRVLTSSGAVGWQCVAHFKEV